jgi:hypothetical protein
MRYFIGEKRRGEILYRKRRGDRYYLGEEIYYILIFPI